MVDFKVRSVTQDSLTSGGMATTQDFTVSGFGTPTAWIVTVSHTGDGSIIGVGFGTFNGVSVDNGWAGAAAPDADSMGIWASDFDAQFEAQALDGTSAGATITTEILEAEGSLITDGIRLTYTTRPTSALRVRVDLIQCDNAFVGTENAANATPSESVTGIGFQPNVLIQVNSGGLASSAGYRPCWGFACESSSTIYQCCQMMASGGNNSTPSGAAALQHVDSTRFLAFITGLGVKSSWTLDSFDADGFTYSDSQTGSNISFEYLLLEVADLDLWCGAIATATTTGQTTHTDPGFAAGGLFTIPTFASTLDSTLTAGNNGTTGFGVFNGTEQGCATASVQDGANPSNTSSEVSTTQGLLAKADDGSTGYAATLSSAAGGIGANYTTANGTARYFLALVWGASDLLEAIDETLSLVEEVLGASRAQSAETLSLLEEVVYLLTNAIPGEADVIGEGGYPAVVQGEGGGPRVEEGHG